MTQYLIRQFKDSTGHIHTNIEKARTNETLSIVEAGSKEEAHLRHKANECKELFQNLGKAMENISRKLGGRNG